MKFFVLSYFLSCSCLIAGLAFPQRTTEQDQTENGTTIVPTTENGAIDVSTTKNSLTTNVATTAVPNTLSQSLLIIGATTTAAVIAAFICLIISVPVIYCCRKRCMRRGRAQTSTSYGSLHVRRGGRARTSTSNGSELLCIPCCGQEEVENKEPDEHKHAVLLVENKLACAPDENKPAVLHFLSEHSEYTEGDCMERLDLGSRMHKYWYQIKCGQTDKLLTVAPVSQNCPLLFHKHQKGLNKLFRAVKVHPYLHPIEMVEYLFDHKLVVIVQPLMPSGSLKDKIHEATPLSDWSAKYSHHGKGLSVELTARYGRQLLEALKFLHSKGFPTLGHVQTGNIFVVDDVCRLGGYENTLLGYRTRLFRLCKDNLKYLDVVLFGHVVFEMAAGYELAHLRPREAEYKDVDEKVRPVLKYIFEEGFPHDIHQISSHEFFSDSLDELSDFDPNAVKLSKSMKKVLKKTRKGKARVQKSKPASTASEESGFLTMSKLKKLGRGRGEQPKSKLSRKEKKAAKSDSESRPLLETSEEEDEDEDKEDLS